MTPVPVEFWLVSIAMLGGILGSYVNMAAYRLPRNISTVTRTRSFCPSCNHQLAWYDNVPILSYLILLGRCHYCRKGIGVRYLLVELLVAGLFVAATYQFMALNPALTWQPYVGPIPPIYFALQLFLIVDLVLLSVVDLETWLIPIETTLWWIPVGLALAVIFPEIHASATRWTMNARLDSFIDSFQGLVLGAGLPWAIGFATTAWTFFYYRASGRNERPLEGMGAGDGHLLGMFGAMLGWKAVLMTLMIGIFVGCFTGISKILWDKLQQRRLGDKWKPWQPTFDLPADANSGPQIPVFWPLLVMGVIVLIFVGWLFEASSSSFSGTVPPTLEELSLPIQSAAVHSTYDFRLMPVYVMGVVCALLLIAYPFFKYLLSIDMLPQGSIVENAKGEKQEVMQGNYVPFGPSLAIAALIVVFYDPLIRSFLHWWFVQGGSGSMPVLPHKVIGQKAILQPLMALVNWLQNLMPKAM